LLPLGCAVAQGVTSVAISKRLNIPWVARGVEGCCRWAIGKPIWLVSLLRWMRAARSISGDWTALGLQWDGNLDGTVFAIAVDKNAPSSRAYLANTAHDAVVGQAKNRSPLHLLTRFRTRPHEMFRLARCP
jgi:hypothetical protein